jgi:hypothetical protein
MSQTKREQQDGRESWTLWAPERDTAKHFPERAEAEAKRDELGDLMEIEMYPPGELPDALAAIDDAKDDSDTAEDDTLPCAACGDGVTPAAAVYGPQNEPYHEACQNAADGDDSEGETVDADVVEVENPDPEPVDPTPDAPAQDAELPERSVSDDPLTWIPGDFVDSIDTENGTTQAINRKGFEVLSHFYEIDVTAELQVPPEDTDHEYARVKATATTPEGRTCEAFGSAHVDRGDDATLLLEMADTRARKRALSIATGVGAVAVSELKTEVQE